MGEEREREKKSTMIGKDIRVPDHFTYRLRTCGAIDMTTKKKLGYKIQGINDSK